jgi:putative SOS response-associated peptidase YedK
VCGRYTLTVLQEQLAEEFELIDFKAVSQRYNIAPTQSAPMVRLSGEDGPRGWSPAAGD